MPVVVTLVAVVSPKLVRLTAEALGFKPPVLSSSSLKMFSLATTIDPTDAIALYNEACIYAMKGDLDLALESLKNAVKIDPDLRISAAADPDFSPLYSNQGFLSIVNQETKIAH